MPPLPTLTAMPNAPALLDEFEGSNSREKRAGRLLKGFSAYRFEIFIATLAVLPFIVAIARSIANGYVPMGDDGLLLLRSRDVFTEFHPLLGTWSSSSLTFGVNLNNPGPLLFDLMALPVKVFGSGPGLAIGVGSLNIACILGAACMAYRIRGRSAFLAFLVVASTLAWGMGSELLFDVWQPHSLIFPFLCFLVLVWAISCGRFLALPWGVAVGSYLLQTHLSYVYLVPALLVVALAIGLASQQRSRSELLQAVGWSGVVAAVAWVQPLWQQFFGPGPANLSRLFNAATGHYGSSETYGSDLALRISAAVFSIPPWRQRPAFGERFSTESLPNLASANLILGLLLSVLILIMLTSKSSKHLPDRRAAFLSIVLIALAWFSLKSQPTSALGYLAPHQLRWLWPIGAFVTFVLLLRVAKLPIFDRSAPWIMASAVALVSLANLPLHVVVEGAVASRDTTPSVRSMISEVSKLDHRGVLLFDDSTLRFAEPFSGPLLAALGENNIRFVTAHESFGHQIGEGRRYRCGAKLGIPERPSACGVSQTFSLVSGFDAYTVPDGSERVIFIAGLDRSESRQFREAQARLENSGVKFDGYGQPLNVPRDLRAVAVKYRELHIKRDRDSVAVLLRPAP